MPQGGWGQLAPGRRQEIPITGWDVPGDTNVPPHGCWLLRAYAGTQRAAAHLRDHGVRLAHARARRAHTCRRSVGSGEGAGWTDAARRGAGHGARLCGMQTWPVRLRFGCPEQSGGLSAPGGQAGPPPPATGLGLCAAPSTQVPMVGLAGAAPLEAAGVPHPCRVLGMGTSGQGRDWETPRDWGPASATSNTEHTDHTLLIHTVPTPPLYPYSAHVCAGAPTYTHHTPTLVHHLDAQMCADVV